MCRRDGVECLGGRACVDVTVFAGGEKERPSGVVRVTLSRRQPVAEEGAVALASRGRNPEPSREGAPSSSTASNVTASLASSLTCKAHTRESPSSPFTGIEALPESTFSRRSGDVEAMANSSWCLSDNRGQAIRVANAGSGGGTRRVSAPIRDPKETMSLSQMGAHAAIRVALNVAAEDEIAFDLPALR